MSTAAEQSSKIDEATARIDALSPSDESGTVSAVDAEGKARPQASVLIDLGMRHHLFHDDGGDAYARVQVGRRRAIYPIKGTDYAEHLSRDFYLLTGKGANRNATGDAINTLSATAKYKGSREAVYLRVGSVDERIVIDIGDATGDAYIVKATGWDIAPSPINFRRSGKPLPLPLPRPGDGSRPGLSVAEFAKIWKYINVQPQDRPLIAGWLLAALSPRGPFPIAQLAGEQGSGKSSTSRILKRLTDPSEVMLRPPPREERDLLTAALSSWTVALDNLSTCNPQLSDCLCRIATGGGFASRRLYTDADEHLINVTRPMILNGIEDIASRPDLASRCLHLILPQLQTTATEAELERGFKRDAPLIFAAMLDGLSLALRDHATIEIGRLPRMADFAKWAAAGVPALGFTSEDFVSAYADNREHSSELALESSPVAQAVIDLMKSGTNWTGSATDLLHRLIADAGDRLNPQAWPRSAKGLIGTLRRLEPALRQAGIEIEHRRDSSSRTITLSCSPRKQASHASHVSQPIPAKGIRNVSDDAYDTYDASIPALHNAADHVITGAL